MQLLIKSLTQLQQRFKDTRKARLTMTECTIQTRSLSQDYVKLGVDLTACGGVAAWWLEVVWRRIFSFTKTNISGHFAYEWNYGSNLLHDTNNNSSVKKERNFPTCHWFQTLQNRAKKKNDRGESGGTFLSLQPVCWINGYRQDCYPKWIADVPEL